MTPHSRLSASGVLRCTNAATSVVLQHVPDWRWMMDRDDSLWYPTHRLFRQSTAGQWSDVFESIYQTLVTRLSGATHSNVASEHSANDE